MSRLGWWWTQSCWVLLLAVAVGWLLTDFQVPGWVWGVTIAVIVHLAWTGRDALFLATVWLVTILWVGVIRFSWPESLHPAGWSSWVLLSWVVNLAVSGLMGMGLILGLALCQEAMERQGFDARRAVFDHRKQTCLVLASLTSLSLGAGRLLHEVIRVLIPH